MDYITFKQEYIALLTALLSTPPSTGPLISTPASSVLVNKLADMEEEHPVWVERIEDRLADENRLQERN